MLPCSRGRVVRPEVLDGLPSEESANSLRDLVRINRLFGGHRALRRLLSQVVRPGEAFTMLDAGAGSGDTAEVVQRSWPLATVLSFDYVLHHLAQAPQPRVCGDAFHMPFRPASFDVVFCSLFLHHFEDEQVTTLLRSFGELARRAVVVSDLERSIIPYYFLPATRWLYRWDPITLHDGPISVEAAFQQSELRSLAERAGLLHPRTFRFRPWFRLGMIAPAEHSPSPTEYTT